jgi:hypothetical protein
LDVSQNHSDKHRLEILDESRQDVNAKLDLLLEQDE